MIGQLTVHGVAGIEVGPERIYTEDQRFSCRDLTLRIQGGGILTVKVFGEASGIPVAIEADQAPPLKAAA
jgi:hypothetical protein